MYLRHFVGKSGKQHGDQTEWNSSWFLSKTQSTAGKMVTHMHTWNRKMFRVIIPPLIPTLASFKDVIWCNYTPKRYSFLFISLSTIVFGIVLFATFHLLHSSQLTKGVIEGVYFITV